MIGDFIRIITASAAGRSVTAPSAPAARGQRGGLRRGLTTIIVIVALLLLVPSLLNAFWFLLSVAALLWGVGRIFRRRSYSSSHSGGSFFGHGHGDRDHSVFDDRGDYWNGDFGHGHGHGHAGPDNPMFDDDRYDHWNGDD